jgi:hypothetical protein
MGKEMSLAQGLSCHVQVMGPEDGYICQFSKDIKTFWGSRHSLELGATFRSKVPAAGRQRPLARSVSEVSPATLQLLRSLKLQHTLFVTHTQETC